MSENMYPKHPRSTVNRLRNRGKFTFLTDNLRVPLLIEFILTAVYDYETIHTIVNACPVVHVSFSPSSDDPFPAVLPMMGVVGSFASPSASLSEGPLDLYLHGSASSRLMRLPSNTDATAEGLPLTIAATHFDGVVLALSPFHHSLNYRSAVLNGYAVQVTEEKEKLYAMELMTNNMVPERWQNSRSEPLKSELQSTAILRVAIETASAKIRVGGPNEDRKDEKDENIRGKIWTGIVPAWTAFGEPVPADTNRVSLPQHVKEYVSKGNTDGKRKANEAVRAKTK